MTETAATTTAHTTTRVIPEATIPVAIAAQVPAVPESTQYAKSHG